MINYFHVYWFYFKQLATDYVYAETFVVTVGSICDWFIHADQYKQHKWQYTVVKN